MSHVDPDRRHAVAAELWRQTIEDMLNPTMGVPDIIPGVSVTPPWDLLYKRAETVIRIAEGGPA